MPKADTLPAQIKLLDSMELFGFKDFDEFIDAFREYCEAGRKVGHYMAVEVAGAGGEVKGELKRQLKVLKVGNWRYTRKVLRRLDNASDHLGDAASDFVGAYHALTELVAEVEKELAEREAKARAGAGSRAKARA
jgi:hypothetical protein